MLEVLYHRAKFGAARISPAAGVAKNVLFVTGSIARSATRRYLIDSEADFEVFRPTWATRCTDGGEIWHGICQISPLSVQRQGCRTPKIEIFTQI